MSQPNLTTARCWVHPHDPSLQELQVENALHVKTRDTIAGQLLECKEVCDDKHRRSARDLVELYMWMPLSTCLRLSKFDYERICPTGTTATAIAETY